MRISDWSSDVCSSDLTGFSERRLPPFGGRRFEQQAIAAGRDVPAVADQLLFKLPRRPSRIAERHQPARRAAPFADRAQDIVRTRYHPAIADLHRLLPAPAAAVEHETARRLDRPAEQNRLTAEERRGGKECVGKVRSRESAYN